MAINCLQSKKLVTVHGKVLDDQGRELEQMQQLVQQQEQQLQAAQASSSSKEAAAASVSQLR